MIKIYKTTTCPYCKMEAEYLQSKGISFLGFDKQKLDDALLE